MEETRRKIQIIFLLFIIIAPSFLFFEIRTKPPAISSSLSSQNYNTIQDTHLIADNPITTKQPYQKISPKFQTLLRDSNADQLVTCLVLLNEQPSDKIAQQLRAASDSSNMVQLRKSLYYETQKAILPLQNAINIPIASLNGRVLRNYVVINALYVELPLQALPKLAELAQIARIEPDYELHIQLDIGRLVISNNTAPGWNYLYNGTGVVVAVCDTGIDKTHPALIGKVINESSFVPGEDTDDYNGHGTHVAGIIASTNNTYQGLADGVSLVNVKVMDSTGSGHTVHLYDGIEWLLVNTSRGADVINLSAGTTELTANGDSALSRFIDTIISSYSVVWANAAGNSGSASSTIEVPGDAINCISVANFNDGNSLNPAVWSIASSSSRGPTVDGREKPDIAAPGTNIMSCNNNWEGASQDFVSKTGTSMSTPFVAAGAALLWQYLTVSNSTLNPNWYALTIKGILLHTAYDLGSAGYDYAFGYGAIDLGAAWNFLQEGDFEVETMSRPYGQCKYRLDLETPQTINVTVVWNRYGSTNYTHTFYYELSNLNLILKNANGEEIASSRSGVDNVEHISYSASNGTYYLIVEVAAFNHDPQDYVICASSPLTFIEKIRTWELYEILLIISVVGIIVVAAVYIVLWYRDRKKALIAKDSTDTSSWPEWKPAPDSPTPKS
jgi:subtilisin family serine protease